MQGNVLANYLCKLRVKQNLLVNITTQYTSKKYYCDLNIPNDIFKVMKYIRPLLHGR